MVPKYPAARARINRNGSDSSGSEISCDTGHLCEKAHVSAHAVRISVSVFSFVFVPFKTYFILSEEKPLKNIAFLIIIILKG